MKKSKTNKSGPKKFTSRLLTEKSQCNSSFIPFDVMREKNVRDIDKQIKKYQKSRKRDFTSQISTLPGAKTISTRPLDEKKLRWKKKFDLRKVTNQAYVSNIDRKHKVGKVPTSHPSYKNFEKPLDQSQTRKGYALKNFLLRETYDFLNPG